MTGTMITFKNSLEVGAGHSNDCLTKTGKQKTRRNRPGKCPSGAGGGGCAVSASGSFRAIAALSQGHAVRGRCWGHRDGLVCPVMLGCSAVGWRWTSQLPGLLYPSHGSPGA